MASEDYNIVIAGGGGKKRLRSVEHYCPSNESWEFLQPMTECRVGASSFLFEDQIIVSGGDTESGVSDTMECLNIKPVGKSECWRTFPATLPAKLHGHTASVHHGKLIITGGCDDQGVVSDSVYEMSLKPPYATRLLTKMPRGICYHIAVLFGNKLVIGGGSTDKHGVSVVKSVLLYSIDENRFEELAPLRYNVVRMAAVKAGEDLLVIGGVKAPYPYTVSNQMMRYNLATGPSVDTEFPEMQRARDGCSAVAVGGKVIVMGGLDDQYEPVLTVEGYNLDRDSWEFMARMNEARRDATAVAWRQ